MKRLVSTPRPIASAQSVRWVVGIMTGTSLDGLDAALVRITGRGLAMQAKLEASASLSLGRLAGPLRQLAEQQPMTAGAIAGLSRDFSRLHVVACQRVLGSRLQRKNPADFICAHGQTVFHAPPVSWQLLTPAVITQELGIAVVCDLRAADLAAGGQGAPITPIADLVFFGHATERRSVINLGGFCNLTRLAKGFRASAITGGDVCACNQVLDGVARTVLGKAFDRNGRAAMSGRADPTATQDLIGQLNRQRRAGRSLGTGDELATWITRHQHIAPADLARSACAAVAQVIVSACGPTDRLILAGGGVNNLALIHEITEHSPVPVHTSDQYGVPAAQREAMAFAVLGALSQDGVAITIPAVTGVRRAPLAGSWTMVR